MSECLDNPVWHALVGPHARFADGVGLPRHYPRDMAPFSGIETSSAAAYADLEVGLPRDTEARLLMLAALNRGGFHSCTSGPRIRRLPCTSASGSRCGGGCWGSGAYLEGDARRERSRQGGWRSKAGRDQGNHGRCYHY